MIGYLAYRLSMVVEGGGGKANGGGNGVNARYLEMLEETIAIESAAGGGGGGKAVPVGGPPAPLVQAL